MTVSFTRGNKDPTLLSATEHLPPPRNGEPHEVGLFPRALCGPAALLVSATVTIGKAFSIVFLDERPPTDHAHVIHPAFAVFPIQTSRTRFLEMANFLDSRHETKRPTFPTRIQTWGRKQAKTPKASNKSLSDNVIRRSTKLHPRVHHVHKTSDTDIVMRSARRIANSRHTNAKCTNFPKDNSAPIKLATIATTFTHAAAAVKIAFSAPLAHRNVAPMGVPH